MWWFYHFICVSICITVSHAGEEIQLNFNLHEETQVQTRIGSIKPNLPPTLGTELNFFTDSSFFSTTSTSGEIRTARVIDRERMCPEYKLCCGVIACTLEARVFVTNKVTGEFVATVKLNVNIEDQNDNRPSFSSDVQRVGISEFAQLGSHLNLVPATDDDIDPSNQIQRYTLIEPTGTFVLDTSALPAVKLQLTRPLDREQIEQYTATLEACDPGACARQTIDIRVSDENDNSPKFPNTQITTSLMENVEIGSVVLRLNATDADSGERGKILYTLQGTIDPDLKDTFELVQDTGEIRLKRQLSASIRNNYRLKIVACDAVNPQCSGDENSTAEVIFMVEDINNFPPSIHIVPAGIALPPELDNANATGKPGDPSSRNSLSILENTPPTQIAMITVKDEDVGDNARVTCSLSDDSQNNGVATPNFKLTPSSAGIYSLRTARAFNYEVEPTVSTKMVCHDFGTPQRLTAARMIVVRVVDVNEFHPEFSRRVYIASVPEESPAGKEVLNITATDKDRGAILFYRFAPPIQQNRGVWDSPAAVQTETDAENVGVNKYFVMELQTGIIRTSQVRWFPIIYVNHKMLLFLTYAN